jgi:cytochrome c1
MRADAAALIAVFTALAACAAPREDIRTSAITLTGGDPDRGKAAITRYGCPSCHNIPGVPGATATVGPPLDNIAVRSVLGGHLTNTPDNMERWIQKPQEVDPKNVMPDMSVTDQDAKDIVAFLYTLR